MKDKRADAQLFINTESTDDFETMKSKVGKAFNCEFQFQRYEATTSNYCVRCLGLGIVIDKYRTSDGRTMYALWGKLDAKIRFSEKLPNLDDCEWLTVDLNYLFITILQAANCGIWRPATEKEQKEMPEFLFGLH